MNTKTNLAASALSAYQTALASSNPAYTAYNTALAESNSALSTYNT